MRVLLVLILILLNPLKEEREVIVTKKMITVTGQTSIGGFSCDYSRNGLKDTLFFDYKKGVKELTFKVPVDDFSCGNFLLNKDFKKTIKAEQYPSALVKVRNLKSRHGYYICDMSVQIVGKELHYKNLRLNSIPNGLSADLVLGFKELELSAPKKFGGLISVDEELHLEFQLGF
ncbi:hypothetical protein A33Q_3651 [Indibacter alkaliphilus LW1]|uniref:YceI-like domain-containing protein n=1 Tax=Indibacter alkaliphilus (strain CCUG 57479 / KCTC 22604 / LW1) TaxID=1189612 RepID=S2D9N9_INDAL|nr:hypothetical protein [Indibacter alkaliphilus]EOZ93705.1 hypothetical protein A33Q_3651 [Indibacter alkaliphilus LW1]